QEAIFIPVKSKFQIPIIDEEDIEKRETSHTEKEKKAVKHLDKTYKLVGKLNIHKLKPKAKEKDEIEEDFTKEREF
ncbi:MAG: hypothetical protein K2H53_05710, partial [Clostridia bacterium]|nr:hypothetical protein [Clostridia bacterium]